MTDTIKGKTLDEITVHDVQIVNQERYSKRLGSLRMADMMLGLLIAQMGPSKHKADALRQAIANTEEGKLTLDLIALAVKGRRDLESEVESQRPLFDGMMEAETSLLRKVEEARLETQKRLSLN